MPRQTTPLPARPLWQRVLWTIAGLISLVVGVVGLFLPVVPTVPLVLLAAFCMSRGCERCERWLLAQPQLGPIVRDWRDHHAVPLRVKQLVWATMTVGSVLAALALPVQVSWLPVLACAVAAVWLWRLPTRAEVPAGRLKA